MKTDSWHAPGDDVDPARAARLARRSRCELVDELESTLRDAVHGTLLADTTVGTLCSGGVDSSLITALAAEKMPDIVAFGASFAGDGRMDEGLAAQRVADALGIQLELVEVTPASWRARVRSRDGSSRGSDRERERGHRRAARRPRAKSAGSRCS